MLQQKKSSFLKQECAKLSFFPRVCQFSCSGVVCNFLDVDLLEQEIIHTVLDNLLLENYENPLEWVDWHALGVNQNIPGNIQAFSQKKAKFSKQPL